MTAPTYAADPVAPSGRRRVLLFGATGAIGQATAGALLGRGHEVVCFLRSSATGLSARFPGAELRYGDASDPASVARDAFRGERFDAVVSCLASRTGAPKDAWAIDHRAQLGILAAAEATGAPLFVLLSAICVQKPRLAFQHAKRAFEEALAASRTRHAIVRPTAYFKSLSGQLDRLKAGKPFLLFGDGRSTACKPISDGDLGAYLADCVEDERLWDRILPIGGPGPAITPREQGERLFALLGREPRFRSVPVAFLDAIIGALDLAGRVSTTAAEKAEFARIGRYYATESMLVWDAEAGAYDAEATPSYGRETLFAFYERLAAGAETVDLGAHKVF
ncbi:MAG: NAD(P)H-binding protein [Pseudomonadota bacterium]